MFGFRICPALVFVLCTTYFIEHGNGAIQVTKKPHHFKNGFLSVGKYSLYEENLVYATCDKNTTCTTKCNVFQEKYPFKEVTQSCFITLKGDHEESDLGVFVGVVALRKNKAILYWSDNYGNVTTLRISTVDLTTCKTNEVKIPDAGLHVLAEFVYIPKVVTYDDDSLEMYFHNPKQCGEKLCKIQINGDGTARSESQASNIGDGQVVHVLPIATGSSSKGYAYLKKNKDDFTLWIVKPDGTEKQLAKYDTIPVVSAGNDLASTCTKPKGKSDITCTQYDENGNVKFTTTISEDSQPPAVYNIPNGGVFVMLGESKYQLVKIGADGKEIGRLSTQELGSITGDKKYTYIYKNAGEGYCTAVVGEHRNSNEWDPSDFLIAVNCFVEADFSA